MKKPFFVANWKSNMTSETATSWIQDFRFTNQERKEVVVCSSFTLLPILKSLIMNHNSSIKLGAQNISPFDEGSYTGEVNGKQIKEYGEFVLIGHSERRNNFNETDEVLSQKVAMAKKYGLDVIFCIQDENTPIPTGITIVAYEPVFAIGTGKPDTPENANEIAGSVKSKSHVLTVLYGGSVTSENAKQFLSMQNIDGILVGKASLDASEFKKIVIAS